MDATAAADGVHRLCRERDPRTPRASFWGRRGCHVGLSAGLQHSCKTTPSRGPQTKRQQSSARDELHGQVTRRRQWQRPRAGALAAVQVRRRLGVKARALQQASPRCGPAVRQARDSNAHPPQRLPSGRRIRLPVSGRGARMSNSLHAPLLAKIRRCCCVPCCYGRSLLFTRHCRVSTWLHRR